MIFYRLLFQSTPSVRGRQRTHRRYDGRYPISIYALCEEDDVVDLPGLGHLVISTHALREEGDELAMARSASIKGFQSTPSGERSTTIQGDNPTYSAGFQSTLSTGRATAVLDIAGVVLQISIHALRVEGDTITPMILLSQSAFQSTPSGGRATELLKDDNVLAIVFQSTPSGGRATELLKDDNVLAIVFQSTPSGGRATCFVVLSASEEADFNPRPPGGGRRVL